MKRKAMYPLAFAAAMFVTSTPVRASETDERIESSFKQTYVYKTYLKDDAIRAEAKEGVVTLTGTVAEESHKALAQQTVANLPGVTRVDNQLAIEAGVTAGNADTWIGRKVKLALQFHRNVNGGRIGVEVKDGIVTLTGEALSVDQKELTAKYAEDIEGVKEVRNEMTVAATPEKVEGTAGTRLDDPSVTAQVMTAVMTHRSTKSINLRVATLNGEVTLTGIARSEAEKSMIAEFVGNVRGVASVKNQMTVEPAKAE